MCKAERFREMSKHETRQQFNNLFVRNFPDEWTENELRLCFEPYGRIVSVRLTHSDKIRIAFISF